jgi:F0F1-type ATP synthase assembly protein I
MIFLQSNKRHKQQHHHPHHKQNGQQQQQQQQQRQSIKTVDSVHQLSPSQSQTLNRNAIYDVRRQQASRADQIKRDKAKDTLLKVLAFVGSVFVLAGIGLLIFGIVQTQTFGYISGGVLIGAGALFLIIMGILMCTDSSSSSNNSNNLELRPTT